MLTVAITTTSFGEWAKQPLEFLKKKGLRVLLNTYGRKLQKEEVVDLCKEASGIIAGTETLDEGTLKKMPKLKVISRCGAGLEGIDIEAAKKMGINVYNTPDAPTQAVAELTIGLILNILRKVSRMDRALRSGKWEKLTGSLLCRKRVGIIGFGRIGRKVAELLKAFDCEISYSDPFVENGLLGLNRMPLRELLGWADIISVHASTKDILLGKEEFKLIKMGVYLVNASRGEIIDEGELYSSINEGRLSGAALDVFEQEPYTGILTSLDNVILTPHIGSYAREARLEMENTAVINLLKGLEILK